MKAQEKLRAALADALNDEIGRTAGPFTSVSAEVVAVEVALTEALPHLVEVIRHKHGQVRLVFEGGRITFVLPEFSHKVVWR